MAKRYKKITPEQKYTLAFDYAHCGSFREVARKHRTYPDAVRRAWNSMSEEQQQQMRDTATAIDERVAEGIRESVLPAPEPVEQICRAHIIASELVDAKLVSDICKARLYIGKELVRRCSPEYIAMMKNADFINLAKAFIMPDQNTGKQEDNQDKPNDIFMKLRAAIEKNFD